MEPEDRKFALRMIPYGVFVLTAINPITGEAAAATVHWVTQTSFTPCLLAVSLQDGTATIGGWGASWGRHGTLVLHNAVSVLECHMRAIMEAGDHFPVIAEVIDVHVRLPQAGRPDDMILEQRELGETIFYGG